MEAHGYWAELGMMVLDLATGMAEGGFIDAAAGNSDAVKAASREKRKGKEEEIAVMMSLGRVLSQVSIDCMRQRKRFVTMRGNEGLDAGSWIMDCIVQVGRVGEIESFGSAQKMIMDNCLWASSHPHLSGLMIVSRSGKRCRRARWRTPSMSQIQMWRRRADLPRKVGPPRRS